jgi:lipoprotein-anchoring transpeptidase ErfK/SrfK
MSPATSSFTPETRAILSDTHAAIEAGQLADAQITLNNLVSSTADSEAIILLGKVNTDLLKSSVMMPGKEYYVIQSGDYLQKIAKKYNTTVNLLKTMNGMESDTIRLGDRLLVFNGDFSLRVSKSRNELDLMRGGKLFKRYNVGTGKFGKTPAVEFSIIDKIVEPPWTRPSDNKQIEYGDPENVLGSRWMAIKSSEHPELTGFGIHGTWERDSIGKQSSAGCVRMLNEDVEELFDLVPRKTSVTISE